MYCFTRFTFPENCRTEVREIYDLFDSGFVPFTKRSYVSINNRHDLILDLPYGDWKW